MGHVVLPKYPYSDDWGKQTLGKLASQQPITH